MANIASAKKRIRKAAKRTDINKPRMNRLRTFVRKFEDSVKSGSKAEAEKAFVEVQSVIAKTAQKGVIHANTARRKISRLAVKIKSL